MEVFRDCTVHSNYEVGYLGSIRNKKTGRVLKPTLHKGYPRLNLGKKKWPVHRVVAMAWIENPEDRYAINHKDGNKTNNAVENLEWCTHRENVQHALQTGLIETRTYWRNCERTAIHILSQSKHYDIDTISKMFLTTEDQIKQILSEPYHISLSIEK